MPRLAEILWTDPCLWRVLKFLGGRKPEARGKAGAPQRAGRRKKPRSSARYRGQKRSRHPGSRSDGMWNGDKRKLENGLGSLPVPIPAQTKQAAKDAP